MKVFQEKGTVIVMSIAGVSALALLAATSHNGPPLISPFERADAAALAISAKAVSCPRPPAGVRNIIAPSKFGQNRREHDSTLVDPDDAAAYTATTRPIVEFTRRVSRYSDAVVQHRDTAEQDAGCALVWLDRWAADDALLGKMNPTGEAVRKWELATLATAYLKIRKAHQDPAAARRVEKWFLRVGRAVQEDYSRNRGSDSRSNNHLNWAAWAVMATAIAADDRALFDWSVARFRQSLRQIEDDGTLPLELKRRQLALSYHLFALAPLIMLHEGATANGVSLSEEDEGRLGLLIDQVISSLDDPAYIAGKSGYPQETGGITEAQLAWLEPYFARSGNPRAGALLKDNRSMTSSRLGGDLTALFRADVKPPRPEASDISR